MPQNGGKRGKKKGHKKGKKKASQQVVAQYPQGSMQGGAFNPAAIAKGAAVVKPFANGKKISKALGIYDKLEKTPFRFLNRIADAGEAIGFGQQGGRRKVIKT